MLSLTPNGVLVITGVGIAAFVVGLLINLLPMRTAARAALLAGVPVAVYATLLVANPEERCQSDCLRRAAWGYVTTAAALGWIVGCLTFVALRGLLHRIRT